MSRLHQTNPARTAPPINQEALQALRRSYQASPLMRYVLRPISLAILVLVLMIGALDLIEELTLDARWSSLAILLFIMALEAVYTTNWLRHPDRLKLNSSTYRAAELFIILIIVRLVSWNLFEEGLPNPSQLQQFLANPPSLFLNVPFIISFVLTLIAWWLAVMLGAIFSDLEISEFELRYYSMPLVQRKVLSDDQPIQTGRSHLVTRFTLFWLWGGILLVACVGLSTLDIRSISSFKNPLVMGGLGLDPAQLVILLIYFGLGFWLLSQAKLMEMNARWLINRIEKDQGLEGQWQKITLLVLLSVGFFASFLPTGPTLAISRILTAAIYVLVYILNLLVFLFTLPLALLLSLFPKESPEAFQPPAPMFIEPFTQNSGAVNSDLGETIMMILSSAFWSVFIVILILALLTFLRERKSTFQGKSASTIWRYFKWWLADLWHRLRARVSAARVPVVVPLSGKNKEGKDPQQAKRQWRFVRLGGLTPREQVRYFYLSTLRRAGEQGVERESAETPLEFSKDLKDSWPEIEHELEELTGAFLKARYSDVPIENDDIPEVKKTWKDVRREIRHQPTTTGEQAESRVDEEQPPDN